MKLGDIGMAVNLDQIATPLIMGGKIYDYIANGLGLLLLYPNNADSLLEFSKKHGYKPFFADIYKQESVQKALQEILQSATSGELRNRKFSQEETREYNRYEQYRKILYLLQNVRKESDGLDLKSFEFRAACLSFDITPHSLSRISLQGYAGNIRRPKQILTPLKLQLLLIEDCDGQALVVVSADVFGFSRKLVTQLRQLFQQAGIPPDRVILNASHTHYSPGSSDQVSEIMGAITPSFTEAIFKKIQKRMDTLFEQLEPCYIDAGETQVKIGANRRKQTDTGVAFGVNRDGYYDLSTGILRFRFQQSQKTVLVVTHGCHPTGLGPAAVISADYPHAFRQKLKDLVGASEVLFLQGAGGSTKQTNLAGDEFTQAPKEIFANGQKLATAVSEEIQKGLVPVEATLNSGIKTIRLPLQQQPSRSELEAIKTNPNASLLHKNWSTHVRSIAELPLEIQLVQIGNQVAITCIPGEPVAELAPRIREVMPRVPFRIVLGYSNGTETYLPTDQIIRDGGYEADRMKFVYLLPSSLAEGVEEKLQNVTLEISKTFTCSNYYSREQREQEGRTFIARKGNPGAFFCLSAGRCGTMTMAHALGIAQNARIYHHPYPRMIAETGMAWQGKIDLREEFWKGRQRVIENAWQDGLIFGSLEMNMTPFSVQIARDIPNARFLVLVRNPWDFVRSGMRRGYYQGHPWDIGRLVPQEGSAERASFDEWSQFEKVCWLWNETYQRILSFINKIGNDRVMLIRLEDLASNPEIIKKVFNFLGLEGYDEQKISQIMAQKLNRQSSGSFPLPKDWSKDSKQILWNTCGDIATHFGYTYDNIIPQLNNSAHSRSFDLNGCSIGKEVDISRMIQQQFRNNDQKRNIGSTSYENGYRLARESSFYDQSLKLVTIPYEDSPWRSVYDTVTNMLLKYNNQINSILDIGCGTGRCAEAIRRAGFKEYLGFDFSSVRINEAKSYVPEFAEKFQTLDVFSREAINLFSQYDTFIMTEFLEHINNDLEIMKQIPVNSLIIFSVPNYDASAHVRYFKSAQEVLDRYHELLSFSDQHNPVEISKPKRPDKIIWVFCAFRKKLHANLTTGKYRDDT